MEGLQREGECWSEEDPNWSAGVTEMIAASVHMHYNVVRARKSPT